MPARLAAPPWYCKGAVSDEGFGDACGVASKGGTAAKRSPIDSEDHGVDMLSGDEPSTSVMPRPPLSLVRAKLFSLVTPPPAMLLLLKGFGSETSGASEQRSFFVLRRRLYRRKSARRTRARVAAAVPIAMPAIAPPERLEGEGFASEAAITDGEFEVVVSKPVLEPGFDLVAVVTVIIAGSNVGGAWLGAAAIEPMVMLFT